MPDECFLSKAESGGRERGEKSYPSVFFFLGGGNQGGTTRCLVSSWVGEERGGGKTAGRSRPFASGIVWGGRVIKHGKRGSY